VAVQMKYMVRTYSYWFTFGKTSNIY